MRLVRLGETGGTTRRVAERDEFSAEAWAVLQKLAREEYRRLVSIGGSEGAETVELSHEALVSQWPRYQTWLQSAVDEKRRLDRLMPLAKRWAEGGEDEDLLLSGFDLRESERLLQNRPSWLSATETALVLKSREARDEAIRAEEERRNSKLKRTRAVVGVLGVALVAALGWVASGTWREKAREHLVQELRAQSGEERVRLLKARWPLGAADVAWAVREVGGLWKEVMRPVASESFFDEPDTFLETVRPRLAVLAEEERPYEFLAETFWRLDYLEAKAREEKTRAEASELRERLRSGLRSAVTRRTGGIRPPPPGEDFVAIQPLAHDLDCGPGEGVGLEPAPSVKASFCMGSSYAVSLTPYCMQIHEVTNAQYLAFNPRFERPDRP